MPGISKKARLAQETVYEIALAILNLKIGEKTTFKFKTETLTVQRVDEKQTQTLKDKIQKYKEFLIQKESLGYYPVMFSNKFKEIFEQ